MGGSTQVRQDPCGQKSPWQGQDSGPGLSWPEEALAVAGFRWDPCGQRGVGGASGLGPVWPAEALEAGLRPETHTAGEALVWGLKPGNYVACGGPRVGFRPRTPAGLPGPKWAGVTLASFPSNPPVPQRSLSMPADPLAVSGPL